MLQELLNDESFLPAIVDFLLLIYCMILSVEIKSMRKKLLFRRDPPDTTGVPARIIHTPPKIPIHVNPYEAPNEI